jgi:hypothetical protein
VESKKEPINGLNKEAVAVLVEQLQQERDRLNEEKRRLDVLHEQMTEELKGLFRDICRVNRPEEVKALEEMLMTAPEEEEE